MCVNLSSLYDLFYTPCHFQVSRYYNQTFSSFQMEEHIHPEFEFMYIAKGSCNVHYQIQGLHYEYTLKQGHWIFIDGQIPHLLSISPSTPCKILNLEVSLQPRSSPCNTLTPFLKESPSFVDFLVRHKPIILSIKDRDSYVIYEIFKNIHTYLHDYPNETLLVSLEICKLLLHLADHADSHPDYTPNLYYVKKAIAYIDEYFDHPLSIAAIANHVGISSAYLQRLFSKQLHQSIIEYITYKKIDKAILLLTQTKLSITDIAIDVGFNSRQHFTHTFKNIVGISPNQFRTKKDKLEIPFTLLSSPH